MITPAGTQKLRDAERETGDGNFMEAIALYESALDGTKGAAEVHYRLGLLYDDKMKDPLNALHHYKRYLTLSPAGKHAAEVKELMKRDELELVTSLSGDSVVTRAEATRLRNENLSLRRDLEYLRSGRPLPSPSPRRPATTAAPAAASRSKKARTYVVEPGDTLVSISRKLYQSPRRWKEIHAANAGTIEDPGKLKVGQTLVIP